MRRLLMSGLLALTTLTLAHGALAADKKDEKKSEKAEKPVARGAPDDEEDDDILAPVRGEGEKSTATAAPVKEKDLKVGFLPLVPIGDASKTLGDQLTSEVVKAFNESASIEVVALQMAASGGSNVASDASAANAARAEGDDLLVKSRALLQKLNFGKAKKGFEMTLAAYEKAAPVLESPQPLIEAWLGLAEVAARQAQDDETRRCLSIVAAFAPEQDLDKKRFPGLFQTAHKRARDGLLKGDRAKIFVDETATGSAVIVDGRVSGDGRGSTAPARFSGLLPGHHLVRVLRDGQAPWGTVVVVEGGAEETVSPGFLAKDKKGPGEDLAQNKLSAEAASIVAEAARAQNLKGVVLGVASKDGGKVPTQLIYVDAKSGKVALLPPTNFQAALLDIGIESLKARSRLEELVADDKAELAEADGSEALIEGARAGEGVTVTEVAVKYDVKISKEPTASRKVAGDTETEPDETNPDDPDAERKVTESKSGTRKQLDEERDPYSKDGDVVGEDAPFTEQGWFLPTVIVGSIVGVAALLAGTGVGLVAAGVIPDPRPSAGAQVNVTVGTAAAAP